MEELKILVEMVAGLPSLALWVVAFFFIYKVSVIGSIYGVIRFVTQRLYDWSVSGKRKEIHFEDIANDICVTTDDTRLKLIKLLKSIAKDNGHYSGVFIHSGTVEWMEKAVNAQRILDKSTKL